MVACHRLDGSLVQIPAERLMFRPGAYAMIFQGRRLLVLRMRSKAGIGLPGGAAEIGETLEQALRREVREETGLEIEPLELAGFKEHFFYYDPTGNAYHGYLFFFHARLVGGSLNGTLDHPNSHSYDPHWVDAASLTPGEFSFHGSFTIDLIQKYLPSI